MIEIYYNTSLEYCEISKQYESEHNLMKLNIQFSKFSNNFSQEYQNEFVDAFLEKKDISCVIHKSENTKIQQEIRFHLNESTIRFDFLSTSIFLKYEEYESLRQSLLSNINNQTELMIKYSSNELLSLRNKFLEKNESLSFELSKFSFITHKIN